MGFGAGDDPLRARAAREDFGELRRAAATRALRRGRLNTRRVTIAAMKIPLKEAIKRGPLLGDGAMGTQLMIAGLEQGACGEEWNLSQPHRVLAIQQRYAEAG